MEPREGEGEKGNKRERKRQEGDLNLPIGIHWHHEVRGAAQLWSPHGFSVVLMSFLSPSAALLFVEKSNHLKKSSTSSNCCSKINSWVSGITLTLSTCSTATRMPDPSVGRLSSTQHRGFQNEHQLAQVEFLLLYPGKTDQRESGREETGKRMPRFLCSFQAKGKLEIDIYNLPTTWPHVKKNTFYGKGKRKVWPVRQKNKDMTNGTLG